MADRLPATTAPKGSKRFCPGLAASDDERIAHREWVAGAVRSLLTIYGDWPADQRLQAEWGKAWADDLEWFPQDVIGRALTAWRRTETRKPTPAAIIKLCRDRMPKPEIVAAEPERPEITPEMRARNRRIIEDAYPELRRMPRPAE